MEQILPQINILNYMYSVCMGIITDMVVVNYHHFCGEGGGEGERVWRRGDEREGEGMSGRG